MRVLFALLLATLAFAAPRYLGLDELIALALRKSPDLMIYRAELNASLAAVEESKSLHKPRVDLLAGGGMVGVDGATTSGIETSSLLNGSIRASQLLYDFGKSGGTIAAATHLSDAAKARLSQILSDKIFEVKRAYYRLLQAKHLIAVANEDVNLTERQRYRARRYFEAGIRTRIDVTDAEVNLLQAKKRLSDAKFEYLRAGYELARVVGVDTEAKGYEILTPALEADAAKNLLPREPLEVLERHASAHRWQLAACKSQIESERQRLRALRGEYYPTLTLEGGAGANETGEKAFESLYPKIQMDAMVVLRWNLYQGGGTDARSEYQRALVLKTDAACRRLYLSVRQEVADAYTKTQKAYARITLSKELAKAAKEKFVQAQKRYEHGLADFIELQQARQSHIDAEASLVVDIYDFLATVAELERAVGR